MVGNIKEVIRMILKKDMEYSNGQMDVTTKENGNKVNNMVREFLEWINLKKSLLNGLMAKCLLKNKLNNKLQVHDTFLYIKSFVYKKFYNSWILNFSI